VVPEIAQNMVHLTMERIEQMVKEIVPDLAQKAIQEEISGSRREKRINQEEEGCSDGVPSLGYIL